VPIGGDLSLQQPNNVDSTSWPQLAKATWGIDIGQDVWRVTLVPAHLQIESILLSKIDLLDEQDIPASYLNFIKHSQFNRTYVKRDGYGGLSYFEKLVPYPTEFNADLRAGCERKRREYRELLTFTLLAEASEVCDLTFFPTLSLRLGSDFRKGSQLALAAMSNASGSLLR
jgi:hypothetical protein